MISIAAAYIYPWLIGSAVIGFLFPYGATLPLLFLRSALAVGVGFGITSSLLFLWLLGVGEFTTGFILLESAVAFLSLLARAYQKKGSSSRFVPPPSPLTEQKIEKKLRLGFFLFLGSGITVMVLVSLLSPHGDWDAWAIWNNRARFLFRSGSEWKNSFSPLLDWSHPDYPLFLPLSIARIWFYLGRESLWVPALTAMLFSISLTVLLVSSLSLLRNKTQGYGGGIILLVTPSFLTHGASQFADIPLAFFFLSVLIVLYCYENLQPGKKSLLVLGGLLAGFSAWTKNEGLLFVVILLLTRAFPVFSRTKGREIWKSLAHILAGLLPLLTLVFILKMYLAPSNDLWSLLKTDRFIENLIDPDRYFLIVKSFLNILLWFGDWPLPLMPLLIGYVVWAGRSTVRSSSGSLFLILLFQFLGYFMVFLFSPLDLKWHMGTALGRLILQLWPGFLFAMLVYIRTPEEVLDHWSNRFFNRHPPPAFNKKKKWKVTPRQILLSAGILFALPAFILVWGARGVSTISWLNIYQVSDFSTLGEVLSFFKNLRVPIPPVIALGEITEYLTLGTAFLWTRTFYQGALVLVFLLAISLAYPSFWRMTASLAFSIISLWSTVIIHPGNPQIYDVFYPLFILLFVLFLKLALHSTFQRLAALYCLMSGFFLSMAELTRPFVFFILPLLLTGACYSLAAPRKIIWFVLPLIMFSGSWHAHQFLHHRQLTWTNHSGFNLIRSWTMVEVPPLAKENHNQPVKPGRWLNVNTAEHQENSNRIRKAVMDYWLAHPRESLLHLFQETSSLFIHVKTGIYAYQPRSRMFLLYKPAVWIAGFWFLLNLTLLTLRFFKHPLKALGPTENILIVFTAGSLIFSAIGEGEEEARFLISLLPLLAVFPRVLSPFRKPLEDNEQKGS